MPGKHVRFARTLTLHSPPTPALTLSSFSPASSGGPLTPPSHSNGLPGPSPYLAAFPQNSPNSQTMFKTPIRVHALLKSSGSPVLNYDVSRLPSTITSHHVGISQWVLSEPATKPPLPSLTIIVPRLPWAITVRPSREPYVTVLNVLEEVYHQLRYNISSQEFHSLPTEKDMRRVTAAYENRYRRIRGSREYEDEKRRGVRRVDYLMGHNKFIGLSSTSTGPDVWLLNTA